jgi:sulfur carrier protein
MNIVLNGEVREVANGATVRDVLTLLNVVDERGLAVARNGDVVLRSAWAAIALADGDRIEVLQAVQGG